MMCVSVWACVWKFIQRFIFYNWNLIYIYYSEAGGEIFRDERLKAIYTGGWWAVMQVNFEWWHKWIRCIIENLSFYPDFVLISFCTRELENKRSHVCRRACVSECLFVNVDFCYGCLLSSYSSSSSAAVALLNSTSWFHTRTHAEQSKQMMS